MACIKNIMGTFGSFWKPPKSSGLTEGREFPIPAGKKLMGITLMPHIPDYLIPGRIKDPVQRNGKFHHSQVRGQMSSLLTHRSHNSFTDFSREPI
jgi:hypothetical protein